MQVAGLKKGFHPRVKAFLAFRIMCLLGGLRLRLRGGLVARRVGGIGGGRCVLEANGTPFAVRGLGRSGRGGGGRRSVGGRCRLLQRGAQGYFYGDGKRELGEVIGRSWGADVANSLIIGVADLGGGGSGRSHRSRSRDDGRNLRWGSSRGSGDNDRSRSRNGCRCRRNCRGCYSCRGSSGIGSGRIGESPRKRSSSRVSGSSRSRRSRLLVWGGLVGGQRRWRGRFWSVHWARKKKLKKIDGSGSAGLI